MYVRVVFFVYIYQPRRLLLSAYIAPSHSRPLILLPRLLSVSLTGCCSQEDEIAPSVSGASTVTGIRQLQRRP